MIALINLGNSNIQSVINALEYLSIDYRLVDTPSGLKMCNKIILPGVGTFGDGVCRLKKRGIFEALQKEALINQKPFFGICLGMQLLFNRSDETEGIGGLGIIDGEIVRLPSSPTHKIPRIGWAPSKLNFDFLGLNNQQAYDFYYLHSFHAKPQDASIVSIETEEGVVGAIQNKNIYGCQFHPEKSHTNGLELLKTFATVEKNKR